MRPAKRQQLLAAVKTALADGRSHRLVLVSHCLLDQNARYQGGASCAACLLPRLEGLVPPDCGIIQLPCPEIPAWGGPDKPWLWLPLGRPPWLAGLLSLAGLPLFRLWTRWSYHCQARRVVRRIRGYQDRGYQVQAVLGIDGSPSCGVGQTLDLRACLEYFSRLEPQALERQAFNRELYARCGRAGPGLFMASLRRQLERRAGPGHPVPEFLAWSLPGELGLDRTSAGAPGPAGPDRLGRPTAPGGRPRRAEGAT